MPLNQRWDECNVLVLNHHILALGQRTHNVPPHKAIYSNKTCYIPTLRFMCMHNTWRHTRVAFVFRRLQGPKNFFELWGACVWLQGFWEDKQSQAYKQSENCKINSIKCDSMCWKTKPVLSEFHRAYSFHLTASTMVHDQKGFRRTHTFLFWEIFHLKVAHQCTS